MRRTVGFLTAATVLLSAASLAAQAPNFAGSWTLVPDTTAMGGGGGGGGGGGRMGGRGGFGGLGQTFTATQDAKTLTITRSMGGNDVATTYNLDGTPTKATMTMRGNDVEQTNTAKFDGAKLVITSSMDMGNGPSETTMTLSMDSSGNLLVETTRPGRNGGAPTTRTSTYKKGS
jgi:hypothetical protein